LVPALRSSVNNAALRPGHAPAPSPQGQAHPLDGLSLHEIRTTCDILKRDRQPGASHRFAIVHAVEPSKAELRSDAAIPRRALSMPSDEMKAKYFPEERLAVFCDGSHHARSRQKAKDAAINAKLEAVGIRAVRISGAEIKFELPKAVARVKEFLG
jgi:hypothetical protein